MSRLRLHPESHLVSRIGWLRAAVLGANDGIISTASLIVGVAAAAATRNDVLIAGVAGLVAGAMSMSAGEYVSVSSQSDTEQADLARERKELSQDPKGELDELTEIYVKRGLDQSLARQVAQQLMGKDALDGSRARRAWDLGNHSRTSCASRADIGRNVFCRGGDALAHGRRITSKCAGPRRVRGFFGLSCPSGGDRGKSRRCKRSARHSPSDILGCPGDGSHRRYRKAFRHSCVKIGAAQTSALARSGHSRSSPSSQL